MLKPGAGDLWSIYHYSRLSSLPLTCRKERSQPHGGTSETPTTLSSDTPGERETWLWRCRGTGRTSAGEAEAAGSKPRCPRLATTRQIRPRQTWTGRHLPWCRRACGRCSCRKGRRGVREGAERPRPPRNCHRPTWSPDLQGRKLIPLDVKLPNKSVRGSHFCVFKGERSWVIIISAWLSFINGQMFERKLDLWFWSKSY